MNNELVRIENNELIIAHEAVQKIIEFQKQKAQMDILEKELKQGLKEKMEELGMTGFSIKGLNATIRKATTRKTIDSKRMQAEIPEIYESYLKESQVASSITLSYDE